MSTLNYILTALMVCVVIGMIISAVNLLKAIKKNRENSVESLIGSIKDFITAIVILIGIEVVVGIIKIFID